MDGKTYTLDGVKGPRGLLVMFICNHCPFVKAVIDRIIRDTRELKEHGIGSVAIMSNDTVNYPEDSFDNMRRWAKEKAFPFPYLLDATQEVAKAYGAVCTPDFFGCDANLRLQYRGRIDATTPSNPAAARAANYSRRCCKLLQPAKPRRSNSQASAVRSNGTGSVPAARHVRGQENDAVAGPTAVGRLTRPQEADSLRGQLGGRASLMSPAQRGSYAELNKPTA